MLELKSLVLFLFRDEQRTIYSYCFNIKLHLLKMGPYKYLHSGLLFFHIQNFSLNVPAVEISHSNNPAYQTCKMSEPSGQQVI